MRQSSALAADAIRKCMQESKPGISEHQLAARFGAPSCALRASCDMLDQDNLHVDSKAIDILQRREWRWNREYHTFEIEPLCCERVGCDDAWNAAVNYTQLSCPVSGAICQSISLCQIVPAVGPLEVLMV